MKTALVTGAAAALLVLCPGGARADEPSARQKDAAEKLFLEGREAVTRGETELACAKFRSSVALFPVTNAVANVARCAEREGRTVEALRAWEQVMAMLPAGDERLGPARERATALGARVPRLTLGLPAEMPPTARILIDGAAIARDAWNAALPLTPGEHTVVVEVPGRAPHRFSITLIDGERKELPVTAGPAAETPPPPPPPPPPPFLTGRRMAGLAVGSVGVAGLAAAGITGGVLLSRDARIHTLCPGRVCSPEGTAEIAGSKPLLAANGVAWGVGLAGVGVGLILLLTGRAEAAPRTAVAPLLVPGGGGVAMGGAF
jgi:hypothetical protein